MEEFQLLPADQALPRGFVSAVSCGSIKKPGSTRADIALVASEVPAVAAGVFTTNQLCAAPVELSRDSVRNGQAQAYVVNSGNANAATAEQGLKDARQMQQLAAARLGINPEQMLVASTGVIGVPLPMERMRAGIERLEPGPYDPLPCAEAIRTTDAFVKHAALRLSVGGADVVISAFSKGAGMICPNMATMLGFVQTDAHLSPAQADQLLRHAVERSFNRILVDGDMSTNDSVFLLANGASGAGEMQPGSPDEARFAAALEAVLIHQAKQIVRDGEGSRHVACIRIAGARDDREALIAARAVADSNLVKAAVFGSDPNWGRIASAAASSAARFDQRRFSLWFEDVQMVANGVPNPAAESAAAAIMQREEFDIHLDLGLGSGKAHYWFSDLGYEYVRINADYRT